MLIQPRQKLIMIGDSITDCERARPVGEGLFGAIGKGYVAQVDALLMTAHPQAAVRVVNMGSSGNTVRDLAARWQSDVLDLRPDWLSIMIGINDVWRQFDLPRQGEIHVQLDEYQRVLDDLVGRTKPTVRGLVLMTPFYIEPNRDAPMRKRMDAYGAAVAAVAKRHGAILVDVQAAFDRLTAHQPVESIAWDRVHPNHIGHMAIARAFVAAIEG
ncbi:MAG: SGNH/GDSL hydrolase family protein [Planctomycetes bacterium]|nr:SGNH/GDSL hydrolase family protein [Planctomycetota bacterium]